MTVFRQGLARMCRRLEAEDGFTIVEVLVAAVVLALGAAAVLMTLVAGIRDVQRGKQTQVAVKIAQREMEKVRSLGFKEVSMTALPAKDGSQQESPAYRLSGAGTEFDLVRSPATTTMAPICSSAAGLCLDAATAGRVRSAPSSTCVSSPDQPDPPARFAFDGASGQVYCYVTTIGDASCPTAKPLCVKRVVVAVWLDKPGNASYRPPYYELQSDFVEPPS